VGGTDPLSGRRRPTNASRFRDAVQLALQARHRADYVHDPVVDATIPGRTPADPDADGPDWAAGPGFITDWPTAAPSCARRHFAAVQRAVGTVLVRDARLWNVRGWADKLVGGGGGRHAAGPATNPTVMGIGDEVTSGGSRRSTATA